MKIKKTIFNETPCIMVLGNDAQVYPYAMVIAGAELGKRVRVQTFSIVEAGASIGDDTTIHPHNLVNANVVIGKDCFISSFVGFIDRRHPKNKRPEVPVEKTWIGDGVTIGVSAVIFPVEIGEGAMIGAHATVLRSILPGEKVKGVVK